MPSRNACSVATLSTVQAQSLMHCTVACLQFDEELLVLLEKFLERDAGEQVELYVDGWAVVVHSGQSPLIAPAAASTALHTF